MSIVKFVLITLPLALLTAFIVGCVALSAAADQYAGTHVIVF